MVIKELFGRIDGKEVFKYILSNGNTVAEILSYGAILKSLKFHGIQTVIGFDSLEEYLLKGGYFGAIVGRNANRIKDGKFSIDGKEYSVTKNEKEVNCLHGGKQGFNSKIWQAETSENAVALYLESLDGEEGFPANLRVRVVYTLIDDKIDIEYFAHSDGATVCNLTNHSYFNLNGGGEILDHLLYIDSKAVTLTDQNNCPYGALKEIKDTPYDFSSLVKIGYRIPCKDTIIIDHNYALNGKGYRKVALAYGDKTGVEMSVYTTEPGIQLYTGKFGKILNTQDGVERVGYASFCLETQKFPNAVNCPEFISPVIRKGEEYYQKTSYAFRKL